MKPGRASRTALKVAIRRAAHQFMEKPPVMHDPLALRQAGFHRLEQVDTDGLNALYFHNRADKLKLSPVGLGMIATAWV